MPKEILKWKRSILIRSRTGRPEDWTDNWTVVWALIAYLPHQQKALNQKNYQLSQLDSLVVTQVPLDE